MKYSKYLNISLLIILPILVMACNRPRRLYLSNKTETAITLIVDSNFETGEGSILSAFKDSLNGKRIAPGHITINFGQGKWDNLDKESLRTLLQNVEVVKEDNAGSFKLPKDFPIGNGIFIPELIVKINEP